MFKKHIMGVVMVYVLIGLSFQQGEYADINVVVESTFPEIIYAGDYVDVYFRVINEGTENAQIKDIRFITPEGIDLISYTPLTYTTNLCGRCSIKFNIKLKLSSSLKPSKYPISIEVDTGDYVFLETLVIDVKGDEVLGIDILESHGTINDYGTIKLNITNQGTAPLENIKLSLKSQEVFLANKAEIVIETLKSKESKIVEMKILVSKDAQEGVKPLTLNVEYRYDDIKIKQYTIPLTIFSNGKLSLSSIILGSHPQIGKSVDLIIRVENIGYGKVKNIVVSIASEDIKAPQQTYYLGTLDTEEDAAAVFTITPLNANNEVNIEIQYEINGKEETIKEVFRFNADAQNNSNLIYYALGLLIIVAFLIYKKVKGNKNENS